MVDRTVTPAGTETEVVTGTSTEPLRGRALYVGGATLVLSAATAWGLKLTADQTAVIIGAVAFLGPQVVWWWARRHVNSPATMKKVLAQRQQ